MLFSVCLIPLLSIIVGSTTTQNNSMSTLTLQVDDLRFVLTKTSTTYTNAVELCDHLNMTLVAITDDAIWDLIPANNQSSVTYWTRVPDMKQFMYTSDAIVWNATQFKQLNSTNSVIVTGNDPTNVQFRTENCSRSHQVICESLPDVVIGDIWRTSPYGVTYGITKTFYHWREADKYCRRFGGTLAKIMTHKEHQWLSQFIFDNGLTETWIGAVSLINGVDYVT